MIHLHNNFITDPKVSFDVAVLAKEKVFFDKNILGSVRITQEYVYTKDGLLCTLEEVICENVVMSDVVNAPTQTALQRWLCEIYGIQVHADFYTVDEGVEYKVTVSHPKTWDTHDEYVKSGFTSIYAALDKGLFQALKLIEI